MTKIILAYAATGKTYFANNTDKNVLDFVCIPYKYILDNQDEFDESESESSKGDVRGRLNLSWPVNYVKDLEKIAYQNKYDYILCPSDLGVLRVIQGVTELEVTVVVPEISLKEEYRKRFNDRGSVNLTRYLIDNDYWESFIVRLNISSYSKLISLKSGEYLSDVISEV